MHSGVHNGVRFSVPINFGHISTPKLSKMPIIVFVAMARRVMGDLVFRNGSIEFHKEGLLKL